LTKFRKRNSPFLTPLTAFEDIRTRRTLPTSPIFMLSRLRYRPRFPAMMYHFSPISQGRSLVCLGGGPSVITPPFIGRFKACELAGFGKDSAPLFPSSHKLLLFFEARFGPFSFPNARLLDLPTWYLRIVFLFLGRLAVESPS